MMLKKRGLCKIKLIDPTPLHFNCKCPLHEDGDFHVSERLVRKSIEAWKTQIDHTLYIPSLIETIALYDHLYEIRNLINTKTLYFHLADWFDLWMSERKQFYTNCSYTFVLCLRRTVFGKHPYLRKLLLHTYLKECGAYRFKKWIAFLLGAVRMDEDEIHKRIKL
jgi:hypothetical protein